MLGDKFDHPIVFREANEPDQIADAQLGAVLIAGAILSPRRSQTTWY
jgi:hypothetical protein